MATFFRVAKFWRLSPNPSVGGFPPDSSGSSPNGIGGEAGKFVRVSRNVATLASFHACQVLIIAICVDRKYRFLLYL